MTIDTVKNATYNLCRRAADTIASCNTPENRETVEKAAFCAGLIIGVGILRSYISNSTTTQPSSSAQSSPGLPTSQIADSSHGVGSFKSSSSLAAPVSPFRDDKSSQPLSRGPSLAHAQTFNGGSSPTFRFPPGQVPNATASNECKATDSDDDGPQKIAQPPQSNNSPHNSAAELMPPPTRTDTQTPESSNGKSTGFVVSVTSEQQPSPPPSEAASANYPSPAASPTGRYPSDNGQSDASTAQPDPTSAGRVSPHIESMD